MLRPFVLIALALILAPVASAQTDWRAELQKEHVVFQEGKMTMEDLSLVTVELPGYETTTFQLRIYSEAPEGGIISRDSFVAMTSTLGHMLVTMALAESYQVSASAFLDGLDQEPLQALIGSADLEFNIYMTNEGVQFEVVAASANQRNRFTQTWEQIYAS
ncbi:MAG: hypothetical protein AAGG50_09830 [Bacteroidota bacterium]